MMTQKNLVTYHLLEALNYSDNLIYFLCRLQEIIDHVKFEDNDNEQTIKTSNTLLKLIDNLLSDSLQFEIEREIVSNTIDNNYSVLGQ